MECWNSRRSPVLSKNGICASNEPTASAIGAKILESGGNAADAAVAIASALNVLQPCMSGLGGDSFALFYNAHTKVVSCLEGNGASSSNISLDIVNKAGYGIGKNPLDPRSGLCVTVPGAAALWEDLIHTHGSLSLAQVLTCAINLADDGFAVSPITASHWGGYLDEEGERIFRPNGNIPKTGDIIRNPDLANTMRSIAELGAAKGYYQGRIAEAIVAAVQKNGGVLDQEDLRTHSTKFVSSLSVPYKGLRIHETPPPSQGLAALIALRLVEKVEQLNAKDNENKNFKESQFNFCPDRAKRSSIDSTHLVMECMRVACAEALHHITDPLVQKVPVEQLLGDQYISATAERIRMDSSSIVRATDYSAFQKGETAYFCVVDRWGNACSMISSNYQGFGTGIMPLGTGFTLQNRGHNFSLQPGHPNQVAPSKRPFHTIIPAMITREADGELFGVMGAMGGFMQPMLHVQLIRNLVDCGMNPQEALDAPRWFLHGTGATQSESDMRHSTVLLEEGFGGRWDGQQQPELPPAEDALSPVTTASAPSSRTPPLEGESQQSLLENLGGEGAVAAGLRTRGHRVLDIVRGEERSVFGWGHLILRDGQSGVLWAGSEPRCDGCAVPAVF